MKAPYIGPRPFEQTDRDIFFGRTQEANELVSLITAHAAVLLYAQSGAGKTSLIKAGLIPLLDQEEKFNVLPPMRVRENVDTQLRPERINNVYMFNALSSISSPDLGGSVSNLSLSSYLEAHKRASGNGHSNSPTAIIFDQFEELFTLYPEHWEARRAFFKQVRDALAKDPLLRVLFAMREDFIAELDPYVYLIPEKLRTRLRMECLREKTALRAVTEPLKKVETPELNRRFAIGVDNKLVNNLLQIRIKTPAGIKTIKGEFVEALQLQIVCQALWEKLKPEDQLITEDHLEAYGDVDKALMDFYENAIKKTVAETNIKEGVLRQWFERTLITPTGTRGTVFRGEKEAGGIPNNVIDELENQRIIRFELRGHERWYELTHDRFVETVQTSYQNWLLSRPASEQVRQRFEERAANWVQKDHDENELLDDVDFGLAEKWMHSPDAKEIEPSPELKAFVHASRQLKESKYKIRMEEINRLEQQAKNASLFRKLTIGISLVALICVVALVLLFSSWEKTGELNNEVEHLRGLVQTANGLIKEQNDDLTQQSRRIERFNKLSNADYLLIRGRLKEAADEFTSLADSESDFLQKSKILILLGDTWLKGREPQNAIKMYDRALGSLGGREDELASSLRGQALMKKAAIYFDWAMENEVKNQLNEASYNYNKSRDFFYNARIEFNRVNNGPNNDEAYKKEVEALNRYNELQQNLSSDVGVQHRIMRKRL